MANASGRASDIIRSRNLRLAGHALLAEARMENLQLWIPWAAIGSGLMLEDWAREWMSELPTHDLPGFYFVVYGINGSADK